MNGSCSMVWPQNEVYGAHTSHLFRWFSRARDWVSAYSSKQTNVVHDFWRWIVAQFRTNIHSYFHPAGVVRMYLSIAWSRWKELILAKIQWTQSDNREMRWHLAVHRFNHAIWSRSSCSTFNGVRRGFSDLITIQIRDIQCLCLSHK